MMCTNIHAYMYQCLRDAGLLKPLPSHQVYEVDAVFKPFYIWGNGGT